MNFSAITACDENFKTSLKRILIWYLENLSSLTTKNAFETVKKMVNFLGDNGAKVVSKITSVDIINFEASLPEHAKWEIGKLPAFFRRWRSIDPQIISKDAESFFKHKRIAGNLKGVAVMTMDPLNGPFSGIESAAIFESLADAFAVDKISEQNYVLTHLLFALGQRMVQYAALKICDFYTIEKSDGQHEYFLKIPRAKQKDSLSRESFKDRILAEEIGKVLARHIHKVKQRFSGLLSDVSLAPIFPQGRLNGRGSAGFEFHATPMELSQNLVYALDALDVYSERTGELINFTTKRFRYSLGTRAASQGHGTLIIAELLDHNDTQHVGVYTQSSPKTVERIDKAVALAMAPMAQAFQGTLIESETQALRGYDPQSRIIDPRFDTSFKPMGNCGSYSHCAFSAPIACYTCPSFQPWFDGPHEAVLDYLVTERERLTQVSGPTIASINDRAMAAVARVVQLCNDHFSTKKTTQDNT